MELEKPSLRKVLGVSDGLALFIGIMIGAGIYSTPQIIAGYLSSFSSIITLWILVGIWVMIGGMIYAELGTRLPYTGGDYIYISRSFGPLAGFIYGWAQLFIIRTSTAAALAIITADYLGYFVKLSQFARIAVALSVLAVLGILNIIGVQRASAFQKITSILKTSGLLALAIAGFILVQSHENLLATHAAPIGKLGPVGNVAAALMLVVFSYGGWDRLVCIAGEMKNPRRVVPLSLFIGIGIIIFVFFLTNLVYHRTLGIEGVRGSTILASDVATKLLGPLGASYIALMVIISTTSSISGTMMASSRVYYAMARDGLFFKWLDFVHPKFKTPSRAIIAHCLWASVIILIRQKFETIATGLIFAYLIFCLLTTISLFKFRRNEVGGKDVYRMPFYPFLPGLYLVGLLALLVLRGIFDWQKSLTDLAFIATGLLFSFIWFRLARKKVNF